MRVIVVGAGGHGQVVADVLISSRAQGSEWEPVGYVDDDAALIGCTLVGLPVLGHVESLRIVPHDGVVVAVGDNKTRSSLFSRLKQQGEHFVIARHPSAVISAGVEIGPGTMICAGVIVNTGTTIGSGVILNTGCSVDHHNRIGDYVHVGPGVHTGGAVAVGSGSLIGIGATIMPGRTLGADSVIGAAALVQGDVANATVVMGVPARPVRKNVLPNS